MSAIIEVDSLTFGYGQSPILKDLSFDLVPGQFLAIIGPNGAGKTTLLNLLCGLLRPQSGSIRIDSLGIGSYSIKTLAQKVAVVRQEFVPVFDFTVAQVVSMARTPYLGAFGFEGRADLEIAAEALEMTDIAHFASRPLGRLSGGERQRVFIARALAQDTPILLLDEPTSFLDLKHQVAIYDLLKKLQLEKGKTVVAVTHDINLAGQYCDQTLLVGADHSYFIGRPDEVFCRCRIEGIFGVRAFAGKVGRGKFFMPLGSFSKDGGVISADSNNNAKE
jgi:iron complex transport system ATP-binding protein